MDNTQTLELQIKTISSNAVKSLEQVINKLTGIQNEIGNVSNKLDKTASINNFIKEIDKATLSAKRLSKIDMGIFEKQLNEMYNSISRLSNNLGTVNVSNLESLNKTFRNIPNSLKKINELDLKKTYSSFNSLTRIVSPFLKELQKSEISLTNFVQLSKSLETSSKSVEKIEKNMDRVKNSTDKTTSSVKKLGNVFTYVGIKKLTNHFLEWLNLAVDRTEQLNLFNVVFKNMEKNGTKTFSSLGREATKFQNRLNETFGTNLSSTTKYQGLFQSMGENVGIPDTYSALMSTTMTKLTYDLASLYNKEENVVAEALRAGVYAGQTKPLRSYGIDVTQTSMQPILESLGITDRSIKQMSQAEKEILRYLATMKQAKVAMGDFANTIESPSNQMKVFRQQLAEAKIALSSLFIGTFSQILPYANAFLMTVKEVAKALADIFGIKLSDYNTGIASSEDAYAGLSDSIDDATDSVKELKRQTLGFDQINNISENKNSDSGNLVGGIDKRLLDAITGYDNGMENVRMKATEIRDKWMEILGFHKEIDPLTGEISFKYQGLKTTLKNSWNWFKKLNTQGKLFIGLGLVAVFAKMFTGVKKINKVAGASGLFGITKNLLSPMKSLSGLLKDDLAGGFYKLTDSMSESVTMWSKSLTTMDKFKVGITGILGLSISMGGMADAMKSVSNEGWNLGNSLQTVASGLGGIASGAYIGSIFGPWGTAIGGIVGLLAELSTAIYNVESSFDKSVNNTLVHVEDITNETNTYVQSLKEMRKTVDAQLSSNLSIQTHNGQLLNELQSIVDANGKIIQGYEDRAKFIVNELNTAYGTEYEIVDGVIKKYDEFVGTIEELISKKKISLLLESKAELYTEAISNQSKKYQQYKIQLEAVNEAETKLTQAQEELKKAHERMQKAMTTGAYLVERGNLEKAEKNVKELQSAYDDATKSLGDYEEELKEYSYVIEEYTTLSSASLSDNMGVINEAIKNSTNTWVENGEIIKTTISDELNYIEFQYKKLGTITEKTYEAEKNKIIGTLVEQSNTVEKLTPEVVSSWGDLATNSKDSFLEAFAKLPEEVQTEVVDKMQDKGHSISEELQEGINKINPTVKIKTDLSQAKTELKITADTKPAEKKVNSFLGSLKDFFVGTSFGLFDGDGKMFANGGFPEDGMFFANHNELVGKFTNGKTAVANNAQIVEGIKAGVYEAVSMAMSQYGGQSSSIDVHVHTDEGTVVDRINQTTKQTGVCPINIPVY